MSTIQSQMPLAGRIAVVTGASSGIGAATAKVLAVRGAKVALLARRKDRLDDLVAEITAAGGTALALATDVTSRQSIDAAARQIAEQLGTVDLVVNNAGIMLPASISELRTEQWQQQIDLNVSGAMHIIGAFVQQLITASETGHPTDLINISSIAAQYLYQNFAVYSATKAFISHLTRHLRLELGPKDIRVSMIEPGVTATELQSHFTDPGANAWFAGVQKTMELLRPEDVAEVVAFTAALPRHVNLQQVTVMPTRMGQ